MTAIAPCFMCHVALSLLSRLNCINPQSTWFLLAFKCYNFSGWQSRWRLCWTVSSCLSMVNHRSDIDEAVTPREDLRDCCCACSLSKRHFSTALGHDIFQDVLLKLGAKMDFTAGVSATVLTFASTAGFVNYESSNMRDDIKQLDSNMRDDIKLLDRKMDLLLLHIAGIPSKTLKVCHR